MAPDSQSIDGLVQQITTSNNLEALAHTLRSPAGSAKDVREFLLASPLSSGQDPLMVLDLRNNTLGVLYILSARLNLFYTNSGSGVQRPPWGLLAQFCQVFAPNQARMAPERVLKLAIPLLYNLATRLPLTPSTLTPIHPILLLSTLQSKHITPTICQLLIQHPIDDLYMFSSGFSEHSLNANDNMIYHYLAGVILTQAAHYTAALDYYETAITAPTTSNSPPSALQLEALKKLRLVQCIALGGPQPLPKYTSPILLRAFKNSPYHNLINAFPGSPSQSKDGSSSGNNRLRQLIAKDRDVYAAECHLGLVERLEKEAPKWIVKRLTETYVTLGLSEIGKYIGIDNENQVRSLVLSMIASKTILATISASGIVTFHDAPGTADVSPEDLRALLGGAAMGPQDASIQKVTIPALLNAVQTQSAYLAQLDMEVGRSKEFISKAFKMNNGGGGSGGMSMGGHGPGFGPGGGFPDDDEFPSAPGMYSMDQDTIMFG
ncbi:hypothetical protein BT96DRAFT_986196 [Gymnopus androsaceus JB14]|uniref:COP9 signalosome complex subunit 3 n=1 Tax=Gymnopus androsaceus JB14 TaxID=1447944 RepID=A0A6A4IBM9_9AGAR|nr:hypothetical protein BT96DRAFT_986196 [Gymnopus androsaceus JB14]